LDENNINISLDKSKLYFEIIGKLEKTQWSSSKNKFIFGCSETIFDEYAKKLKINQESLISNLNNFLALSGKIIIPFLNHKEIRFLVVSESNSGGLELDNFTAGLFGTIIGLTQLSKGKIKKKELMDLFEKNKELSKKKSRIYKALKFLIMMNLLDYDSSEQSYMLGNIGKVIISNKAKNELGEFLEDKLYK